MSNVGDIEIGMSAYPHSGKQGKQLIHSTDFDNIPPLSSR